MDDYDDYMYVNVYIYDYICICTYVSYNNAYSADAFDPSTVEYPSSGTLWTAMGIKSASRRDATSFSDASE